MAEKDYTRKCPECSGEVVGRPYKIYCSQRCMRRFITRRAKKTANCTVCDKEFKYNAGNTSGKFCSYKCANNAPDALQLKKQNAIKQNAERREQGLKKATGQHSLIYDRKCIECDGLFHSARKKQAPCFCSPSCRKDWEARYKTFNIRWSHNHPLIVIKVCPETGWVFKADNASRIYATEEIAKRVGKRIAKAKRRARKRTNGRCENIDPIQVFRDANYVCQICGVQTDKTKRGLIHDLAPELDHIVPLSKGGEHTHDNVQCACKRCNANKSNLLNYKSKGAVAN